MKKQIKNKHCLDKPVLRDLFWFIVLPYQFKQYLKKKQSGKG